MTLFLALLLATILVLLATPVQRAIQPALRRRPDAIWLAPPLLTAIFAAGSLLADQVNYQLIGIVLAYTITPTACVRVAGVGPATRPSNLDFAAILLLWLPLEFPAGAAHLIAKHAQGFLHSVAYGIAILLGLLLFLCFRQFDGMKYNLPHTSRDWLRALMGFALTAPVLAAIGIPIGFIPMPHWSTASIGRMATAAAVIFFATALPEEILFRSMVQNLLMQRFGQTTRTLVAASLIFGAAHLDNGPQAVPNWRYFILATIAGYAYGKVFQRSTSVLASTLLHALVDWTKHFYF